MSMQEEQIDEVVCFCEKKIDCKSGTMDLVKHFLGCAVFQKESPIAKEFNDIPLEELSLEPLTILRAELFGYLLRVEKTIKKSNIILMKSKDDFADEILCLGGGKVEYPIEDFLKQQINGGNKKDIQKNDNNSINNNNKIQIADNNNNKIIKNNNGNQIKEESRKMEEEKVESSKKPLKQKGKEELEEEEEHELQKNLARFDNSQPMDLDLAGLYQQDMTKCCGCGKEFDSNLDLEKLWFLQTCLDVFCKKCLHQQISDNFLAQKGCLKCKKCSSDFQQEDYIAVLGKDKFEKLDNTLMEQMCNFATCCKCNQKYDFQKGDPNSSVIGKDGQPLNKQQLVDYAENRFTCPNPACRTEQCKLCKAIPYHLGQSCGEFKKFQDSKRCRYCDKQIEGDRQRKIPAYADICFDKECTQKVQLACRQMLPCQHPCCGIKDELKCPPCLFEECASKNPDLKGVTGKEFCNICFVEELQNAPVIQSKCGHIFHYECLRKKLEVKWLSPRIVFNFCLCPLCKAWLELPPDSQLYEILEGYRKLFLTIKDKALKRLKHEEREKDEKLTKKDSFYFDKPVEYAMAIYSYYMCFKCKTPYFGGLKDCERALNDDKKEFKPSDLICPNCCEIPMAKCKIHGDDFMEFKCRYCCSIAVWFCFGTTHFCEPCHNKVAQVQGKKADQLPKCKGVKGCPFKGEHNPNGEETPLGCSICRNIKQSASEF